MAELQGHQLSCRTQQKSMTREGEQTFRHTRDSIRYLASSFEISAWQFKDPRGGLPLLLELGGGI